MTAHLALRSVRGVTGTGEVGVAGPTGAPPDDGAGAVLAPERPPGQPYEPERFAPPQQDDQPRAVVAASTRGDVVFKGITFVVALISFLIVGTTAVFLAWKSRPAFEDNGYWGFLTDSVWNDGTGTFGVGGLLLGTILIASIALLVAIPIALSTAVFVNEYAPGRVRPVLVSLIDLLAAVPSIVFGMWGLFALQNQLTGPARWLGAHLSAIPLFNTDSNPTNLGQSAFIAGCVVGVMIVPIITSVARDVMAQVPRELCEGALALGGSRWGMVREVVLPFGAPGIVGAVLLGFGRALGETIAVAIIIALVYPVNTQVLTQGAGSIAALIAIRFAESDARGISALIAAGLALFVMTLFVNGVARVIVSRSKGIG
jgi:phosphate transport system permease protein